MKEPASPILSVSFVVPAYNADQTVTKTIDSITGQNLTLPREVLVVDDGSQDKTQEKLAPYHSAIRIIRNATNRGAAYSRNSGIRESRGDILILVDADVCLEPGSAQQMVEAFEKDPGLSLVAPKICYETQGIYYPDFQEASQYAGITACIAMRKKNLEPINEFFDELYEVFFEDTDFFVRMRHAGLKFRYLPEAVVTHRDRSIRHNNEATYYLQIRNSLYALRKLSGIPRFPHELSWKLYAKYLVFGLLNYAWFNDRYQKGKRTYGEKILSKLKGPRISKSPLWPLLILATIFRSWLWNLSHSPPLTRGSKSA